VLIGWDFNLGYPAGFAEVIAGMRGTGSPQEVPWHAVWRELFELLTDTEDNCNNRFEVAGFLNQRIGSQLFWGTPKGRTIPYLNSRSPVFPVHAAGKTVARRRLVEQSLSGTQEAWKLLGVGSVGSQAITGIPVVYALRNAPELSAHSKVWPYETTFADQITSASFVHVEIWPGVVKQAVVARLEREPERVRDEVQVLEVCHWLSSVQSAGGLTDLLSAPKRLSGTDILQCCNYEGWVLGAE
jgi:hypothetical protein